MNSDYSANLPLPGNPLSSVEQERDREPISASFEAALAELEGLVQSMERPGLPLEALLQGYQRGMALSQFCQQKLSHVQGEVERLTLNSKVGTGFTHEDEV
jgi:exodeoxyribonuclease VII small subunit